MLARYLLSSCVRLCVRPSQAGVVSKRPDESSWFLAWRLLSTYKCCYEEIWVSPTIRVLPSKTSLSQTPDLENFATASRDRVVNKSCRCRRRRSSLLTTPRYDNRRVVAVYYKSVNCNPLTPLFRFVVDLLYMLFLQLTRFWLT